MVAASFAFGSALAAQSRRAGNEVLAITHVRVVDVSTGAVRAGQTLIITSGRIRAVGNDGRVRIPRGARVMDAHGLHATPGLWDMHVHTSATSMRPRQAGGKPTMPQNADFAFPLFVANGVTGIRDMSGDLHLLLSWRKAVESGERIGPRMVVTGNKVGGSAPVVPGAPFPLVTDDDIRGAVRALERDGGDFVKYLELPAAQFPVLMAAARESGLRVSAHVPPWMPLGAMSDAGVASTEHLLGMAQATSSIAGDLLSEARREQTWWGKLLLRAGVWNSDARLADRQKRALESVSDARTTQLFEQLKRNATWQVPTLTAIRHVNGVLDDSAVRAARAPYHLPFMVGRRKDWAQGDTLASLAFVRYAFRQTAAMARAGVPMLAGSDMPGTNRLPGFSLVDELEFLVQAGLTPLQALQMATVRPADFLGARDSLGTIEAGRVGDLLFMRGNPLENIGQLRQLDAVVVGGRFLSRSDLDALLAQARTRAAQWRAEAPRSPE